MEKMTGLTTALAAITAVTFAVWVLKRRRRLRLLRELGIPGPNPDFIWGNLMQMHHRRLEAFTEWRKEYGRLFGIYVGSEPFLVISDPEMAHECTVKQTHIFQDRPVVFVDAEPFKSSLFQLRGNARKYVRSRLNYCFSSGTFKDFFSKANACAARFAERMSSISRSNGFVEVFDRGLDFTFEFIMNSVLAQKVKSQEGNKEPILESLRQVIKDMEHSAIDVAFTVPVVRAFLNLIYPLTRHGREFRNVIRHVREAVELRRSGRLPKEPCILETVLDQQSQTLNAAQSKRSGRGIYLEDHYVTSNVAIFLLAGIETTASLLSFLMHQLAKHPEEQRKIVEEMEDVLPTKEGSEFSFDQLHLLKRVDMVIYEGLRLYPSVPLYVVRRCAQDTTVCGQFIPAGVNVMIAPWLIHRDHDYWPEPDEFIPDRFAEESSEGHRRKVYIPFGLGPKVCIGQKLALLVVKSALVQILQKHRLTLGTEASGGPILSLPGMALVPGDGVKVSLERRQAKAAA